AAGLCRRLPSGRPGVATVRGGGGRLFHRAGPAAVAGAGRVAPGGSAGDMTVVAGVAGQPISQSLSPLIHKAWIAAAGLDADYRAFGPADEGEFAALAAEGRSGRLRGLNVTAPF